MYGAWMIARQCITVSGVKTELLFSVTIVVNGEEGGVGTLGSESFPSCLLLRLASRGPCEVLSYLLDKFRERFSNGAVTGPPHKQNKTAGKMQWVQVILDVYLAPFFVNIKTLISDDILKIQGGKLY